MNYFDERNYLITNFVISFLLVWQGYFIITFEETRFKIEGVYFAGTGLEEYIVLCLTSRRKTLASGSVDHQALMYCPHHGNKHARSAI